jgi:hypothetical protein
MLGYKRISVATRLAISDFVYVSLYGLSLSVDVQMYNDTRDGYGAIVEIPKHASKTSTLLERSYH